MKKEREIDWQLNIIFLSLRVNHTLTRFFFLLLNV